MKKWVLCLALTGVLLTTLSGCMSTGSTWETREPTSGETELIIQRPWNYLYSRFFLQLVLDQDTENRKVVHIENGKKIRMLIPNGEHSLTVVLDTSRSDVKDPKMDWIVGYAWQINLINSLAVRLGVDFYPAFSYAYVHSDYNKDIAFNVGLTGLAGLMLFPKGKYFVNIDACPGFTFNPFKEGADVFAFILPIRLTVGANIGKDIN